jgi:hypothetical protein
MSSFGGTAFKVGAVAPGTFPHIARESPLWRYRCRARIDSTAAYRALLDKLTVLTPEPILGTLDAFVQVEAGPAAASLVVPDESGASITFAAAYLTGIRGTTDGRVADRYVAELEFAIRGDVTP